MRSTYTVSRALLPAERPGRDPTVAASTVENPGIGQLLTFGHGTASREEILTLLHGAGVRALVDVRTAPKRRRHPSFRGYAGHTRTADFVAADFAELARGIPVQHLMHDGRLAAHRLSEGVRLREDGLLVYDDGQLTLP